MIGRITGPIIEKSPPLLTIDVNGLGYEVFTPMNTFYQLGNELKSITLITHHIVREDHHALYGFQTHAERDLFRHLIKVNGIGPKLALTILSSMELAQFTQHITNGDSSALIRIPGVGKKTAERLIIEMRGKLDEITINPISPSQLEEDRSLEDAIRALLSLGYKQQEAKRSVKAVHQPQLSSEQLIRLALKNMSKG